MTYDKMDFNKFAEKVKAGGYADGTAARRALGKCDDWKHSKQGDQARALIDRTWSVAGTSKPAKQPKNAAKPGPQATKVTKAAKPAKRAARAAAKAHSKVAAGPGHQTRVAAKDPDSFVPTRTPLVGGDVRHVHLLAAGYVIGSLRNAEARTARESHAIDVAVAEYAAWESPEARALRLSDDFESEKVQILGRAPRATTTVSRPRIEVPAPATSVPAVTEPAEAASPTEHEDKLDEAELSPEEKVKLARIRDVVSSMPALGPNHFTTGQ